MEALKTRDGWIDVLELFKGGRKTALSDLGHNLEQLCAGTGLTPAFIAASAGVALDRFQQIQKGELQVLDEDELQKLSCALGATIDDIVPVPNTDSQIVARLKEEMRSQHTGFLFAGGGQHDAVPARIISDEEVNIYLLFRVLDMLGEPT